MLDIVISQSVTKCTQAVSTALSYLTACDIIGCCRINRTFGNEYTGFERLSNGKKSYNYTLNSKNFIFISSLWESALRITYICRTIASNPDSSLTKAQKYELDALKNVLEKIMAQFTESNTEHKENILLLCDEYIASRDRLSDNIRHHTENMTNNDFDDGELSYTYLSLMHYIYTFLLSSEKLLKQS